MLVQQLRADAEHLKNGNWSLISEACRQVPNRKSRAGKDLALRVFPDVPKTTAYIQFAYLLRDLFLYLRILWLMSFTECLTPE